MDPRIKKIGGVVTLIGGILGVLIGWNTLGYPTIATSTDTAYLEVGQLDNTLMILQGKWHILNAKIANKEAELAKAPDAAKSSIREVITLLTQQREDVQIAMDAARTKRDLKRKN